MKKSMGLAAIAMGSALALAACSSENADADGDGEISAEEMRAEVENNADAIKPEPGKYKMTMEFVSADIPGAPPEMQEMMAQGTNNSTEFCMTEEMAEAGYEEALTEGQADSCTMEKFDIDGGDIDMAMTCEVPGQGTSSVAMTGSVTPTSSEMNIKTEGTIPGMGEATMEMKMTQERIGDCDA